jgi:hypothetical protein
LIGRSPKAAMFCYRSKSAQLTSGWIYHGALSIVRLLIIVHPASSQFNSRHGYD